MRRLNQLLSKGAKCAQKPRVDFYPVSEFLGWDPSPQWILDLITANGCKNILEVGCGANPTLSQAEVSAIGVRYTANDISPEELEKTDKVFDRWVCDLSSETIPLERRGTFDLVFSRMVNEHVSNGRLYHANIYSLLKPKGVAAHCFSTLYTLPFLMNRILPDSLSTMLLRIFRPRDPHKLGKFHAYYSWSRGPSPRMISRFESLGYEIVQYLGYFGHTYYSRMPLFQSLEVLKARLLLALPIAAFCSYAMVILKKR